MKLDQLLRIYRKARESQGKREHDRSHTGRNLSCGDEVTVYVKLDGDTVSDISFEASGCAISTSFTYLMAERLKGRDVKEILSLSDEEFLRLMGLGEISPGRIRCALIPLVTLRRALRR